MVRQNFTNANVRIFGVVELTGQKVSTMVREREPFLFRELRNPQFVKGDSKLVELQTFSLVSGYAVSHAHVDLCRGCIAVPLFCHSMSCAFHSDKSLESSWVGVTTEVLLSLGLRAGKEVQTSNCLTTKN